MADSIKPRKLGPGSTVAIIAPAGPPKADRLQKGLKMLREHGYKPKVYPQVRRHMGYLAGDDRERASAIMEAFSDKSVDGILASRGGYGCLRLLPYIDFKILRRNPKVFVGYSDLTVLLLSIYKKCNFVTFHGPMTAVEFGRRPRDYTNGHFFRAIEDQGPLGAIKKPIGYKLTALNGGSAEGVIVGGNLSLIARMAGTVYLPAFAGKIVFIEDTEEEPYRLDAYLAQLFLATDITKAAGFILGEFTRTESRYGHVKGWSAERVLRDYFSHLKQPVLNGFPCGHGKEKITIPIGVRVRLDANRKLVTFIESGVRE
jgi:muramoyltetrapeptide carboxypeptidase